MELRDLPVNMTRPFDTTIRYHSIPSNDRTHLPSPPCTLLEKTSRHPTNRLFRFHIHI